MPLRARLAGATLIALALAPRLAAQQPSVVPLAMPRPAANVGVRELGLVLGAGVLAGVLFDGAAHHAAHMNAGDDPTQFSNVAKRFGQPEVYATVALGLMGSGLVTGRSELARSGLRVAGSVALAAAITQVTKSVVGRRRPDAPTQPDGDEFAPFHVGDNAFPSGHTAAAFALATSLADDIHSPWASVALYGMATATGIARVQQQHHWLSDVLVGAAVGYASAKFTSGRLTFFGIRAPALFVGPNGAGLAVSQSF